ncbi:MAG: FAD-binding oxidoreductase [Ardenticatenales bacterium]|nr:FAD-binding oxidoreductase [Ardenticatenales bacterium]
MNDSHAEIVIAGAGIGGVATAYHLARKYGKTDVLIIDPEPPLSVTSDKSFEGYRNWWPGPDDAMVSLTNDSIDMIEAIHRQHPDYVQMDRNGYVFASQDPGKAAEVLASARESCALGAGELRVHRGQPGDPLYRPACSHGVWDAPDGADVILDRALIRQHFPHLHPDTAVVLHTRRCGIFSARMCGSFMLEQAQAHGVRFVTGEVVGVTCLDGAVTAVDVQTPAGRQTITTDNFVVAAGPGQKRVAALLGVDLPVTAELHMKVSVEDREHVLPRDLPITVSLDRVYLDWSDEERELLAESEETAWLLAELPDMAIARAEGGPESNNILLQWHYRLQPPEPAFPLPMDPDFPEYVLRGVSKMLPGLSVYKDRLPKPFVDGGYYVRTSENRPIIGPLPVRGAFIIGALSGSGMQLAPAGGELLADHIAGGTLPHYAAAFRLERFDDPEYLRLIEAWGYTGNI